MDMETVLHRGPPLLIPGPSRKCFLPTTILRWGVQGREARDGEGEQQGRAESLAGEERQRATASPGLVFLP